MSLPIEAKEPQRSPIPAPPVYGNLDPTKFAFFEQDFAFVDTETTGMQPGVDKIVEIAIVRYRNGVAETFHTLIDPEMPIPPTASAVHHITDEMIAQAKAEGKAPTFSEVAGQVKAMLHGAAVYAHNAKFDEGFVDGELQIPIDPTAWICTVRLCSHLLPAAPSRGNQVLRYWLKTNPASAGLGAHRAIDDVYVSLENLYHLWNQAAALGLRTTEELHALANTPLPIHVMPLGKHAGKAFKDIPSDYFQWCLGPEGMKDMDADLRAAMFTELRRDGRKSDDDRLRAVAEAGIIPATVMTFGNKHNGQPIGEVPTPYLEWMERENPRCTPEIRLGVAQELARRRATPAPSVQEAAGSVDNSQMAACDLSSPSIPVRRSLFTASASQQEPLLEDNPNFFEPNERVDLRQDTARTHPTRRMRP